MSLFSFSITYLCSKIKSKNELFGIREKISSNPLQNLSPQESWKSDYNVFQFNALKKVRSELLIVFCILSRSFSDDILMCCIQNFYSQHHEPQSFIVIFLPYSFCCQRLVYNPVRNMVKNKELDFAFLVTCLFLRQRTKGRVKK